VERAGNLPPVESVRYLDLAFIVDGTLRNKVGQEIKPNIEPARKFLLALLDELQTDSTLNTRVALCVYGDWKVADAEFAKYELPRGANSHLCEPRTLQPEIRDPAKFKATPDLDYEALLELGLRWANSLRWRQDVPVDKHLVIIGSAPPHPPQSDPYYPTDSGLSHEPLTSPFIYRDELKQLRASPNPAQRVHIWAVWVPYPELGLTHPCVVWSKRIWNELADNNPDAYFEDLSDETRQKLLKSVRADLPTWHLTRAPILVPFIQQEHSLRWTK